LKEAALAIGAVGAPEELPTVVALGARREHACRPGSARAFDHGHVCRSTAAAAAAAAPATSWCTRNIGEAREALGLVVFIELVDASLGVDEDVPPAKKVSILQTVQRQVELCEVLQGATCTTQRVKGEEAHCRCCWSC
jgi:hypothetical protein